MERLGSGTACWSGLHEASVWVVSLTGDGAYPSVTHLQSTEQLNESHSERNESGTKLIKVKCIESCADVWTEPT